MLVYQLLVVAALWSIAFAVGYLARAVAQLVAALRPPPEGAPGYVPCPGILLDPPRRSPVGGHPNGGRYPRRYLTCEVVADHEESERDSLRGIASDGEVKADQWRLNEVGEIAHVVQDPTFPAGLFRIESHAGTERELFTGRSFPSLLEPFTGEAIAGRWPIVLTGAPAVLLDLGTRGAAPFFGPIR